MATETTFIETTAAPGKHIRHVFVRQSENPQGLLMILPGRGYLIEHPLLHFLQKMASELGYDVLGIRYSFQATVDQVTETINYDLLLDEIDLAMKAVLAQRRYGRVCIAGKSLGTPLAVRCGAQLKNVDLRYILLTPIANATAEVDERPTLAVIGTADAAYNPEQVVADEDKPYMHWHVLDGVNHGLEFQYGWDASIAVLGRVIAQCESFLKAK